LNAKNGGENDCFHPPPPGHGVCRYRR
jgi:hypothetical protein